MTAKNSYSSVQIMGVINVTPDSFSDGGKFHSSSSAIKHAENLANDGADILDFGAESTRPGSLPVSPDEEWLRLEAPLRTVLQWNDRPKVSIDTRNPATMIRAADLGVDIINDVGGARSITDIHLKLGKDFRVDYVAMHMQGSPKTMQKNPLKGRECALAVADFFTETHRKLAGVGFTPSRIWLDPGFGFGKDDSANAWLAAFTLDFAKTYNLCVGVSRKSFLGRALDIEQPVDRDPASKMFEFGLALMGAKMIRTHNVAHLKRLLNYLN